MALYLTFPRIKMITEMNNHSTEKRFRIRRGTCRLGIPSGAVPRVLTCQVVVLLAVVVRQGHQLPEQQRVLEHSLHGLDEVGLQRGRVLLGGVAGIQERLEGLVSFGYKHMDTRPLEEHSGMDSLLLHFVFSGLGDHPRLLQSS